MPQPLISDYAFLSDCRSSALVSRDGSVDWLCWPRFDSPSLFGGVLDPEAGSWSIAPDGEYTVERQYLPGTLILQTRFRTEGGVALLEDWMHRGSRLALCRRITMEEGEMAFVSICHPRPDYARMDTRWEQQLDYWRCATQDHSLFLDGFPSDTGDGSGVLRYEFSLPAGEHHSFSLGWKRPGPSDVSHSYDVTADYWERWSGDLQLPERYAEACRDSALVLKGLQYEPSGSIIAAATTSLPESIGGERNWDYRYSWLRDATFTLYALRSVGKTTEGQSWVDWVLSCAVRNNHRDLAIMYGIDGESNGELHEQELGHLRGYRDSRPVRIGNGAADQRQLDTYGEMLDCLWLQRLSSRKPINRHRALLAIALAEKALREWRLPDEGIWEVRGNPQHFVYSKAMCWVALDRAVRLARTDPKVFFDAPFEEWKAAKRQIREQILARGYDAEAGYFTQSYGSDGLDASNLLLAQVGFVPATDPRFIRTVRATQEKLTQDGMVLRYRLSDVDDHLAGEESPFVICTLWLVLALAQIGDIAAARELFEKVLDMRNDVGLLSECVTPAGEHLGNTPQAFSHIALIACASVLSRKAIS